MADFITDYMWCIHVAVRVNSERRIRGRLAAFTSGWVETTSTGDFLALSFFEDKLLRDLMRRAPIVEYQNGYERLLASIPPASREKICRRLYDLLFRHQIVEWPHGISVPRPASTDAEYDVFFDEAARDTVATGLAPSIGDSAVQESVQEFERLANIMMPPPSSPGY